MREQGVLVAWACGAAAGCAVCKELYVLCTALLPRLRRPSGLVDATLSAGSSALTARLSPQQAAAAASEEAAQPRTCSKGHARLAERSAALLSLNSVLSAG